MNRTAFILAAGLGTRLKQLTETRPKALVEVHGKPMLESLIVKLKKYGFSKIVINVHHFAEMIIDFLNANDNFGVNIFISDERECLLDTGGAIIHAQKLLHVDNFLVHNVDIISDINFNFLFDFHEKNNCLSTVAVRDRESSRKFLFNKSNLLCGWKNYKTGKVILNDNADVFSEFAFSGLHIINADFFAKCDKIGRFSIIPEYIRLSATNNIQAYVHNEDNWIDVGTLDILQNL